MLALALAACGSSPEAAGDAGLFCEVSSRGHPNYITEFDVLLVVDTTAAMQPFAGDLAFNMPRFANVLQSIQGGMPGVHIGVISGDGGAFRSAPTSPDCTAPDGAFLSDEREPWFRCSEERWTRCGVRNYDGTLDDALPCIGLLPADSTEPRRLLESMVRAIDGTIAANAGFDRAGTPLAIVIIAAGDDGSDLPVTVYAEQLRELSDDAIGPVVSVIAPADSPRLNAFADLFPQRNVRIDVQQQDWSEALLIMAQLLAPTLDFPCLQGADITDLYPEQPGPQIDCAVTEYGYDGTDRILPSCAMATASCPDSDTRLPCWWLTDWGGDYGDECSHTVIVEREGNPRGGVEVRCAGTCE